MVVGGTVSGVTHIARGVVAMPKAIIAVQKGKWWNEATRKWVRTNLTNVEVPDNDDDLLKPITEDLDKAGKPRTENSGSVKDPYYYDILEVDPRAERSTIKRRYYVLARKYHPDRVSKNDTEAAEKFKDIAEAYQVLSDAKLRAQYDKDGRDGLSGDRTEVASDANNIDPSILVTFLFGSDKFHDYFGRLATSTSAMLGDTTKLSLKEARILQERRCTRLAKKLAAKLEFWIEVGNEECKAMWREELESLKNASYGWQLIQAIGMAYEVTASQFLGSNESGIGMPTISDWAKSKEAKFRKAQAGSKHKMESFEATMSIMKIKEEYMEKINAATTDDEKKALENEEAEKSQDVLLQLVWTTTVVDITSTIHETCQMVFFDQSVDKNTRKKRAHGVRELGIIFQECQAPEGVNRHARDLFEDASLAATVETMKRKDAASHSTSSS